MGGWAVLLEAGCQRGMPEMVRLIIPRHGGAITQMLGTQCPSCGRTEARQRPAKWAGGPSSSGGSPYAAPPQHMEAIAAALL